MYLLIIILYFLSFWLLLATVAFIFWPAQVVLRQQLQFYEENSGQDSLSKQKQPSLLGRSFLFSYLLERLAPLASILEKQFQAAGWKWQPGDFVGWHFLTLVLVGSLTTVFVNLFLALVIVVVLAFLPVGVLAWQKKRRQQQFSQQLPETLTLLATSLKAGYGLMQAFSTVAQESAEPMKTEIEKLLLSSRLGLSTEAALDSMVQRVNYEPFSWIVLAVKIQRQTGGNLAAILETTATTLRQREAAQRQVKVLTAEGRLSAFILSSLPFFVLLVLYFLNRHYLLALFTTKTGQTLLILALFLILSGIGWFKKIINLKE